MHLNAVMSAAGPTQLQLAGGAPAAVAPVTMLSHAAVMKCIWTKQCRRQLQLEGQSPVAVPLTLVLHTAVLK